MDKKPTTNYLTIFSRELEDINKLEETPGIIRDQAVQALESVLANGNLINTDRTIVGNTRDLLRNINKGSIKDNFKTIYSQMCVLAVSSLESVLKRYFENSLNDPRNINRKNKKLESSKISFLELVNHNLKYSGEFGKLVVEKNKPNFQDLKSIKETFKDYIAKEVNLDIDVEKKICFYLEARHVIVHKGGIVDEKFIKSTEYFGANIKEYKKGDTVEINESDWADIKASLSELVKQVTGYSK